MHHVEYVAYGSQTTKLLAGYSNSAMAGVRASKKPAQTSSLVSPSRVWGGKR